MNQTTARTQRRVVTFPAHETSPVGLVEIVKSIFYITVVVLGFLAAFTFNDAMSSIKGMQKDLYSLQASFAALAQHVQDQDNIRR